MRLPKCEPREKSTRRKAKILVDDVIQENLCTYASVLDTGTTSESGGKAAVSSFHSPLEFVLVAAMAVVQVLSVQNRESGHDGGS